MGKAVERMGMYTGSSAKEADDNLVRMEKFLNRKLLFAGNNQDQLIEGAGPSIWAQFVPGDSIGKYAHRTPPLTTVTAIQLAFTNPKTSGLPDGQGSEKRAVKRALLMKTINGVHDEMYAKCFQNMVSAGFDRYICRFGSEGDIPWPPHSFQPGNDDPRGNDDLYRQAFRHVVTLARKVFGTKLVSTYTTTSLAATTNMVCADGKTRRKIVAGYPGNDIVDVVGIDIYYAKLPLDRYDDRARAAQSFAFNLGKQFAFDEWGITPGGRTASVDAQRAFIRWVRSYLDTLPASGPGSLAYHSFFAEWSQSDFFDDYAPLVQAEVKKQFGT